MSSNDEILAQFIAVTQCPQDQAQRYLEASNWNMDTAMECFYDDGASTSHVPSHQNIPITNLNDNSAREGDSARATGSGYASDDDDSLQMAIEKSMQSATVSQDSSKSTKKQPPQSSRFGTIASLQKEDDSSDEEGQAFYAGGSERSGQQIIGPPKPKLPVDKDKEVENVFKAARDQGAKEADDSHSHDDHQHKQKAFGGVGYTLGDESTPSRSLDTTPSTSSSNRNQANNALQIPILFYKNGFTVDDGELRRFEENRAFIDSITRGEVPEELRKLTTGGRQVEVITKKMFVSLVVDSITDNFLSGVRLSLTSMLILESRSDFRS
ncbi:unnamed protein product [Didymodactylos carnosus]|uniref:SEP domain-containing protein n=1 Tax=Didymodactylos carnosus TaxID=1234261 RepID=A0A8S2DDI7_9BILA|nr:unnamed protein product [Didymodactylos carnosus]CAF3675937.1 unnamed protein product [Didymodactylos carnosus]